MLSSYSQAYGEQFKWYNAEEPLYPSRRCLTANSLPLPPFSKDEFAITTPGLLCLLVCHAHESYAKQRKETVQALLMGFLGRPAPASLLHNRSALNLVGDWADDCQEPPLKVGLCCHITKLRALLQDPLSHAPWVGFASSMVSIYNASLQCDVCKLMVKQAHGPGAPGLAWGWKHLGRDLRPR